MHTVANPIDVQVDWGAIALILLGAIVLAAVIARVFGRGVAVISALGLLVGGVFLIRSQSRMQSPSIAYSDEAAIISRARIDQLGPPTAERVEHPETLDDMWDRLTGSKIDLDVPAIPVAPEPTQPNGDARPQLSTSATSAGLDASPHPGTSAEDQAAAQLLAYLILQAAQSQAGAQKPEEAQATREAAVHVSQLLLQAANSDAAKQAADAAKVAGEKALDAAKVAKSLSVLLNSADQWQALTASTESVPPVTTQATSAPPADTQPPAITAPSSAASLVATTEDSIAPDSDIPAPTSTEPRPDWMDDERVMADGRRVVLKAGPYASKGEVRQDLEMQLAAATMERLRNMPSSAKPRRPLDELPIPMSELLHLTFVDEYVETSTSPSFAGLMKTAWMLVEFTPETDKALLAAWADESRRAGIRTVAATAGGALSALALVAGLLRIDTMTRGYYTKRLFLGVPAAIIAGVVVLKAAFGG